jgi:protein MPE1
MSVGVVYYKFASERGYDTVSFSGHPVRAGDLRRRIVEDRRMARGLDFELVLANAQSGHVYESDEEALPRHASLVVRRIAAPRKQGLLSRMRAESCRAMAEAEAAEARRAAAKFVVPPRSEHSVGSDDETGSEICEREDEDAALARIVAEAAERKVRVFGNKSLVTASGNNENRIRNYRSGHGSHGSAHSVRSGGRTHERRYNNSRRLLADPSRPPPEGYVCNRCGIPGHWIRECPGVPLDEHGRPKLPPKKRTGIPATMIRALTEEERVAADPSLTVVRGEAGGLAVVLPSSREFERHVASSVRDAPSADAYSGPVPPHLRCPLHGGLVRDPVRAPCCSGVACDRCLTDALLESRLCPVCGGNSTAEHIRSCPSTRREVLELVREEARRSEERRATRGAQGCGATTGAERLKRGADAVLALPGIGPDTATRTPRAVLSTAVVGVGADDARASPPSPAPSSISSPSASAVDDEEDAGYMLGSDEDEFGEAVFGEEDDEELARPQKRARHM